MPNHKRASRRGFLKSLAGAAAAPVLVGFAEKARAENGDERITAVTLIRGIEGKEEELKGHLVSLAAPTHAEPGCITYDLYQSPDKKNRFMRFEVWKSLAALEAHKATPHIKASFEKRQREGWTTEILVWQRVPE